MSFGKVLGTFSKKGGSKAASAVEEDSGVVRRDPSSTSRSFDPEDDQMTRRSVMVDEDMDLEAFGKMINQGQSMRFQFAEEDDEDDDKYEYNAEISVFPPRLEDAVGVCKDRAKEWSTATTRFSAFLEKRIFLELETYRQLSKFTRENLEVFSKEGFKGDGSYYRGIMDIMRTQELLSLKAQDFLGSVQKKVLDPLNTLRKEHDKSRKRLWAHFEHSHKKLTDAIASLDKSKAKYQKQAIAWGKTLQEKAKEQSSNYKVKLDKKNKEEEEAHQQTDFLEQQYRENVRAANKALEEHKKGSQLIISAFERLLKNSDDKLKEFLALHAQLEEEYTHSLLPQAAESRQTIGKIDDLHFLQQFIAKVSSGKSWHPAPYVFERHEVDGDISPGVNAEAPKGLHNFKKVTHGYKCRQCEVYSFVGMECVECGLHCHRKCVEKLKGVCAGPVSKTERTEKKPCVFGFPLSAQPLEQTSGLPFVVFRCIQEVEKRGMSEEGIYRVGGKKTSIDTICGLFEERGDSDNAVDLSVEPDINAITGCLKAFFRKLPEPLVPYQLYAPLIAMASQSTPSVVAFSGLLGDFPTKNFEILKVLIEHLKRVSENSEVNKMRASNLGIIFGPSLLRSQASETDPLVALSDNSIQSKVIETLILGYDEIFKGALALRERRRSLLSSMGSIEAGLASLSQTEETVSEEKITATDSIADSTADSNADPLDTDTKGDSEPEDTEAPQHQGAGATPDAAEGKRKKKSKEKGEESGEKRRSKKDKGKEGSPAKAEESPVSRLPLEVEPQQPVRAPEEEEKRESKEKETAPAEADRQPEPESGVDDKEAPENPDGEGSLAHATSFLSVTSSIEVNVLKAEEKPAPYTGKKFSLPDGTTPAPFSLISEVPSYSGVGRSPEDEDEPNEDLNRDDSVDAAASELVIQAREVLKEAEVQATQKLTAKIQNLLDDEED